eukprot:1157665-Pelagomonas_calceolata.AAC.13
MYPHPKLCIQSAQALLFRGSKCCFKKRACIVRASRHSTLEQCTPAPCLDACTTQNTTHPHKGGKSGTCPTGCQRKQCQCQHMRPGQAAAKFRPQQTAQANDPAMTSILRLTTQQAAKANGLNFEAY